jgi:outer membrane protein
MTTRTWNGGKARAAAVVAVLCLASAAARSDAQTVTVSPAPPATTEAAPGPALRTEAEQIRLALPEALQIALQNNLGLTIERYSRTQADQRVLANLGIFDLVGFGGIEYTDSEGTSVTRGSASQSKQTGFSVGLSQLFVTGTTLDFSLNSGKTESNSEFEFLNPSYGSNATVEVTHPLLRNGGRLATERNLLIARNDRDASVQVFETRVTQLLRDVENAYWSLSEAQSQLEVAEQGLSLAKELDQMNRVRVDVGTLAPLELVSSEAGIATREGDIIVAQAAVGNAQDTLRRLLNVPAGELWSRDIVAETEAETAPPGIDVEAAIQTALTERPELEQQRIVLKTREIELAYNRNQAKPRLDLTGSVSYAGAAGRGEIVDPTTGQTIQLDTNLGDALEQVTKADFPTYKIGLSVSFPFQNRTAKANVTLAELELEKGRYQLRELESAITTEVRTAARNVDSTAKLVEAARATRRLQEKNLDAERKRYENGMSTSFQVLEIQEDVTTSRSFLVRALAAYRRAIVTYYASLGELLDHNGVAIAE